jgi:hypothetical protein
MFRLFARAMVMLQWITCYYGCTVYVSRSRREFLSLFEGDVAVCDVVSGIAQCSTLNISLLIIEIT